MDQEPTVQALRRELLSTGSASADVTALPMTADEWRSAARTIARGEGRTVRTFDGTTLHAVLTDWPANDAEEKVLTQSVRRGIEDFPAAE